MTTLEQFLATMTEEEHESLEVAATDLFEEFILEEVS